jgi:hypothetical protein
MQAGGNTDELQEKSKSMKKSIQDAEEKDKEISAARDATLVTIGNLVHDSVPVSNDEVRPTHGCSRNVVGVWCVSVAVREGVLMQLVLVDGLPPAPTLPLPLPGVNLRLSTCAVQANNAIVRESGTPRQEDKLYNHVDLVQVGSVLHHTHNMLQCRNQFDTRNSVTDCASATNWPIHDSCRWYRVVIAGREAGHNACCRRCFLN